MAVRIARLPGIRFEAQPPPPAQVLPRMDIAAFVGFAASGPLNVPVVVEDAAHFRSVFGEDLPLAWDEQRGTMDFAYLAPAVRAFFRNGGKRCYVIRVAGEGAEANRFPIPGLLRQEPDGSLSQAFAFARSEGSWSDELQAGFELLSRPIRYEPFSNEELSGSGHRATLRLSKPGDLQQGDLLRLRVDLDGERYQCLFVPQKIENAEPVEEGSQRLLLAEGIVGAESAEDLESCRVTWQDGRWFRLPGPLSEGKVGWAQPAGDGCSDGPASGGSPPSVVTAWLQKDEDRKYEEQLTLTLDLPPDRAPEAGTLLQAEFNGEMLWMVVYEAGAQGDKSTVTGPAMWECAEPANWTSGTGLRFECLRMRLTSRKGDGSAGDQTSISGLGFAPGHAFYWRSLPTDTGLYASTHSEGGNPYRKLWQAAAEPRFPFAGEEPPAGRRFPCKEEEPSAGTSSVPEGMGSPRDLFFPLVDPSEEVLFAGPAPAERLELERDGLASFTLDYFLDPYLKEDNRETLAASADYLTYQREKPHYPIGIHAALRLEEATLIAAPDALHTGWRRGGLRQQKTRSIVFQPQDPECTPPLDAESEGPFREWRPVGAPHLFAPKVAESNTAFRVSWTPVGLPDPAALAKAPAWRNLTISTPAAPEIAYRLEEAAQNDFSDAVSVYAGGGFSCDFTGRDAGEYYYRVRAEVLAGKQLCLSGEWSNVEGVRIGAVARWKTIPSAELDENGESGYEDGLAAFHSALLTMCAARGDLFALLELPAFFHEDEAQRFCARLRREFRQKAPRVPSFGAVYHPWLYIREKEERDRSVLIPPGGTVCGAIARRTLARGAWLAAANDSLQDIVALTPPMDAGRYLELQECAVNIVRREPRGFMGMSEETLSNEEEFRPIHVRRLMMLLRRLALRQGALYVFEPNSPAFRRQVQSGFEAILADLFARGAFRGSTPSDSYLVDVGDRLNPPSSVEQGRMIVELRVAPSQALTFLTIRLVMTGVRNLQFTEESA
jgi:hypothetical protein